MQELQEIRGNRLEKLKGKRKGQYSIRIKVDVKANCEILFEN